MHFTQAAPGLPEGRRNRPRPGNRVHYDRDGVRVTTQWLELPRQRYAVSELRDLRTLRGRYPPVVGVTVALAMVSLFLATLGFHASDRDPAGWAGAAALALVPLGLALAVLRLRPRRYELWAEYRGATVPLFSSPDVTTYGRVTRALLRAAEASRTGPVGEGADAP